MSPYDLRKAEVVFKDCGKRGGKSHFHSRICWDNIPEFFFQNYKRLHGIPKSVFNTYLWPVWEGGGEYTDGIHYLKQIIINLYVFNIFLYNKRYQNVFMGILISDL